VSPSRAHSLFAGQKNRTLVPMKVGVCTLTEAPQQVQLHGGYTKDTQVRPRTYPPQAGVETAAARYGCPSNLPASVRKSSPSE
jgi:hypothetical protein